MPQQRLMSGTDMERIDMRSQRFGTLPWEWQHQPGTVLFEGVDSISMADPCRQMFEILFESIATHGHLLLHGDDFSLGSFLTQKY
jgi:hypothetical protein